MVRRRILPFTSNDVSTVGHTGKIHCLEVSSMVMQRSSRVSYDLVWTRHETGDSYHIVDT